MAHPGGQVQNKRQRERQKQAKRAEKIARKQEKKISGPEEEVITPGPAASARQHDAELLPLMRSINESPQALESELKTARNEIDRQTREYPAAISPHGRTALMYAAGKGDVQCVEILLNHGANKMLKDSMGETALDLARKRIRYGKQFQMIADLLSDLPSPL